MLDYEVSGKQVLWRWLSDPEFTTLIMDANGALHGTRRSGGSKTQCGGIGATDGCGTVFRLTP